MSNLTVSYVSHTPAAPSAGGSAAAPATDSPLGFLAALIDQLLAAGTDTLPSGGATNIDTKIAGLLDVTLDGNTGPAPGISELSLAGALLHRVDGVAVRAAAGDAPAPGELPGLQHTVDALIALLDTGAAAPPQQPGSTAPGTQPPIDIAALREHVAALGQSLAATAPALAQKLDTLAARLEPIAADPALAAQFGLAAPQPDPDAPVIAHIIRTLLGHADSPSDSDSAPAPQPEDELLQAVASLGAPAPSNAPNAPSAPASDQPTASVPAPLLRLSNQLTQIAQDLAATAPDLAGKLDAVATRLISADADPNLLGKLTGAAAQPDGTALDKLVQSLIAAKPAPAPTSVPATPQIAAPRALTLPAPIAPARSKSAVTEVKAAPPEPAPVAADSPLQPAPRIRLTANSGAPSPDPALDPRVDARIAPLAADAPKPDATIQPAAPPQPAAPAPVQHARTLPAAYQAVANPINMGQMAFELVRQVHQGTSRFTIRLDPPELGRVDVKMHVDASGTLNARLTVDRAETLDLFQRDQRSLERALAQAGLDANKTSLEFSLRQQQHNPFAGMMGGDHRHQHPGYGSAPRFAAAGTDDAAPLPAITLYRGTASAGGVNIFA